MASRESKASEQQITGEPNTRELILRAAAKVFLSRGYEGTSMDLVASESGAGRRTVYNQFRSKKALFDATVSLMWEGMPLERIVERRPSDRPPSETLHEIGHAIASFWAPDEAVAFLHMIVAENNRFPELAESFFSSGRGIPRRTLSEYLKALDKAGTLHVPDPELAAGQFISLINGLLLWDRVITCGPPPSAERQRYVVEEAVRTFLCRHSPSRRAVENGSATARNGSKASRPHKR